MFVCVFFFVFKTGSKDFAEFSYLGVFLCEKFNGQGLRESLRYWVVHPKPIFFKNCFEFPWVLNYSVKISFLRVFQENFKKFIGQDLVSGKIRIFEFGVCLFLWFFLLKNGSENFAKISYLEVYRCKKFNGSTPHLQKNLRVLVIHTHHFFLNF